MKIRFTGAVFSSIVCFAALILAVRFLCADQLEEKLMDVYSQARDAAEAADVDAWHQCLSSNAWILLWNYTISIHKRSFNAGDLRQQAVGFVDADNLTFTHAVQKGPTAKILCFIGEWDSFLSLYVIDFVREEEKWKLVGQQSVATRELQGISAFRKDHDPAHLRVNPVCVPSGKLSERLKLVKNVDHIGRVNLSSYGYASEVLINGFQQGDVTNGSISKPIVGGINDGINELILTVQPLPDAKRGKLHITIELSEPPYEAVYDRVFSGDHEQIEDSFYVDIP